MCGIAGIAGFEGTAVRLESDVRAMTAALAHRGPDGDGVWLDPDRGVALGHRRLAVIAPGPEGRQPMTAGSGHLWLTYNGEIYNYRELRSELQREGASFRNQTDTEVLLAAWEAWGPERTLDRVDGMFAFAVWDSAQGVLHLVRDRLGIKPLYYGRAGGALVFGSDAGALRRHPDFDPELDPAAVHEYFRLRMVPGSRCIHRHAAKLEPGTRLEWRPGSEPRLIRYWSAVEVARRATESPLALGLEEGADRVEALLGAAVQARTVADVPLGALLSGGLDSTLVTALLARASDSPVRTFTIGFEGSDHDESEDAGRVAEHLGTRHTMLRVTSEDALAVIPELPAIYNEPFADSSQIPTVMVSRLAREQVTVALSGDGGDEVFGGYHRHIYGPDLWSRLQRVPPSMRRPLQSLLTGLSRGGTGINRVGRHLPGGGVRLLHEKLAKLAVAGAAGSPEAFYDGLVQEWSDPCAVLRVDAVDRPGHPDVGTDLALKFMLWDALGYLPDDILTKVDRASMASSLEVRVPFLEPAVLALGWSLPAELRIASGSGKRVLRHLLTRFVPGELLERPKMGFQVPLATWLRGPLRPWAEDLLSADSLRNHPWVRTAPARAVWNRHLAGTDESSRLWTLLMFLDWLRAQAPSRAS